MAERARWGIKQIATELGFTEQAVKKWRGNTIRTLREAGQLNHVKPTCPLPRNALPVPANQREHVREGAAPRWEPDDIIKWARRTQRRDPVTGATTWPSPPGRTPDPARQPRERSRRAQLVAAA